MSFDLRVAVPSLVVATLAAGVVIVRAAGAPPPVTPPERATPEDLRFFAAAAAHDERDWLRQSIQDYPEDHWSARDDFHAREMTRLRELAGERKVPIEDVLRAVDDDLHAARAHADSPDFRAARAIPCKPRPFYD